LTGAVSIWSRGRRATAGEGACTYHKAQKTADSSESRSHPRGCLWDGLKAQFALKVGPQATKGHKVPHVPYPLCVTLCHLWGHRRAAVRVRRSVSVGASFSVDWSRWQARLAHRAVGDVRGKCWRRLSYIARRWLGYFAIVAPIAFIQSLPIRLFRLELGSRCNAQFVPVHLKASVKAQKPPNMKDVNRVPIWRIDRGTGR
jgi:hypothetical protein